MQKKVKSPYRPKTSRLSIISNADRLVLKEELNPSPKNAEVDTKLLTGEQSLFARFTYVKTGGSVSG